MPWKTAVCLSGVVVCARGLALPGAAAGMLRGGGSRAEGAASGGSTPPKVLPKQGVEALEEPVDSTSSEQREEQREEWEVDEPPPKHVEGVVQPSGGVDFPPPLAAFSASMNSVTVASIKSVIVARLTRAASSTDGWMGLATSSPKTAAVTVLVSSVEVFSAFTDWVVIMGLVASWTTFVFMGGCCFCSPAEASSFTESAIASDGGWTQPRGRPCPKQGKGTSGAGEPSARVGHLRRAAAAGWISSGAGEPAAGVDAHGVLLQEDEFFEPERAGRSRKLTQDSGVP